MDKEIMKLKDELMEELAEIGKKGVSGANLDAIYKMATAAEKICKMEQMDDGEYSEAGYRRYYRNDGRMGDMTRMPYDGDSSYARRGRHYVRGHYSYDEGKHKMIEQMEELLEEADTEKERETIRRRLRELK